MSRPDHHIAARSAGVISVTQPPVWYGGESVGTRPSIRRITRNAAPSCVQDLSNISTGSFHLSFTVQTTQAGYVALVNQRGMCNLQPYWDVRLADGNVEAETDDGGTYYYVTTSGTLATTLATVNSNTGSFGSSGRCSFSQASALVEVGFGPG